MPDYSKFLAEQPNDFDWSYIYGKVTELVPDGMPPARESLLEQPIGWMPTLDMTRSLAGAALESFLCSTSHL